MQTSASTAAGPVGSGRAPAPIKHLLSYRCRRPCPAYQCKLLLLCEQRSRVRSASRTPRAFAARRHLPVDALKLILEFCALPDWHILLASSGEKILPWQINNSERTANGSVSDAVATPLPLLEGHSGLVTGLAHSPLWGRGRFISSSNDTTLCLWRPCFEHEAVEYKLEKVFTGHNTFVTHVLNAGRGLVASAGRTAQCYMALGVVKHRASLQMASTKTGDDFERVWLQKLD